METAARISVASPFARERGRVRVIQQSRRCGVRTPHLSPLPLPRGEARKAAGNITRTHPLLSAKFRHHICNFHRRPGGFGAAIDAVFETADTGLIFISETEHHVDHWHCLFYCDALK